jgi:hypothetical protein
MFCEKCSFSIQIPSDLEYPSQLPPPWWQQVISVHPAGQLSFPSWPHHTTLPEQDHTNCNKVQIKQMVLCKSKPGHSTPSRHKQNVPTTPPICILQQPQKRIISCSGPSNHVFKILGTLWCPGVTNVSSSVHFSSSLKHPSILFSITGVTN